MTIRKIERMLIFIPERIDPGPAFTTATRLARGNRIRMTIMDVVADVGGPLSILSKGTNRENIQTALIAHRFEEIESLVAEFLSKEADTTVRVVAGSAFIEVVREVLKSGHQIVIKPVGGPDRGRARLLGGDDMHLLRKCPCPVWMVKNGRRSEVGVVLAAIDPVGVENRELSVKVLELAADIAVRDGAALHVVHGWNLPYEDALRSRNVMSDKAIADMRVQIQVAHKERVEKLLSPRPLADLRPEIHLVEGRPSKLILEVAAREKADLIVMGTVGRTGVSGFLIGNTAERVLNEVRCSVLAVKPDGFETPIR